MDWGDEGAFVYGIVAREKKWHKQKFRKSIAGIGTGKTVYLKQEHPARHDFLILAGKLWTYLAGLNEQAKERMGLIIEQMKAAEGVTEELKAQNQFDWVGQIQTLGF